MISNRPYLIRALYEWIVDNAWTPHLQVDANYPGIAVPQAFAQDGMIVLNVHPEAVRGLSLDNDAVVFKARFNGQEHKVFFPPEAVLAIFARENGQGMPFPPEAHPDSTASADSDSNDESAPPSQDPSEKKPKRSHLTVVK
mgnify:CR=1 FL=1